MRAAGLKAIDTVVESTAVLVKSRNTKHEVAELVTSRIRGVIGIHYTFLLLINWSIANHKISLCSRSKIRPVPVQYQPRQPRCGLCHHPGQACSHHHSVG